MSFKDLPPQPPAHRVESARYAALSLELSEQAARTCLHVADIAYGDDYWQKVDVYLPADTRERNCPVMVCAHGGAWTHGYKEWMGLMAPPLLARGIILVSVSYRLAPDHKHPQPMQDCAAALGWVHAHIAEHGGDPNRMVVSGHSAGGHLYSLVALRPELLARHGVPLSALVACAPVSAQMNFEFPERPPGSAEERIHQLVLTDSSQARDASPVAFISAHTPYMFLSYGERDFDRIIYANKNMAARLAEQGRAHETLVLPGLDHYEVALSLGKPDNAWTVRIAELFGQARDN